MVSVLGQRREVLLELRRRSPQSPRADELPVAVWARLYADLAPYLAQRSGAGVSLLGFYHRVVGGRAAQRYGAAGDARTAHRELASFFGGRPVLRAAEPTGETADPRTAAEMPYHLTCARMWKELGQTLCDLQFARAKCMAGMVHDLVNDYEAALGAGAKGALAAALEQFLAFVRRDAHTLGRYAGMPAFVEQQAHNFRRDGPVRHASAKRTGDRAAAPWFKRLNLPGSNPVLQATMTRHTASALDCVFTPDGLHLLSCGNDGAIRMWTPDRWAHVKRVAQLPAAARSCDVGPDGSFVISAGGDGVIRRHDLASGEVLEFRHPVPEAERCRVSPDGDYVVACGEKGAVLFDASGRKLWARPGVYYDVAFRGDGVAVLVGQDIHPIKLSTGATAGGDGVQARNLYGCAFSPDRRTLLVAGGNDTALYEHRRVGMAWTMDASAMAATYTPTHEFPESALSCRFLPGGDEYAIGLRSGSLLIFRTADGRPLRTLGDHTGAIRGIAISPDGRHLVTASLDSRLHAYACSELRKTGAEEPPGAAAFSAFSTGGREARVWHARASNVHMDFGETVCSLDTPDADPSYRRLDPDVGFRDVRIAGPGVAFNETSGAFLPAVDAGRHTTPHRTAPAFGRSVEAYWLFAVGSRMTDFDLHFLPPLDDGRQHSRAVTWARSADKWRFAVLRRDGLVIYRDDLKRRTEIENPTDATPRRSPARLFLLDRRRPPVLHRRARDRRHRRRARPRRAAARLRQRDAVGLLRIWRPEALARWRCRWRTVGMGSRHRRAAMGASGARWIGDRLRLLRRERRDVDRRGSHALPVDAWAGAAARRLLCGRGAFNLCGQRRPALHRRRRRSRRRSHAGAGPAVRRGARRCGGRRRSVGAGCRCTGDAGADGSGRHRAPPRQPPTPRSISPSSAAHDPPAGSPTSGS